MDSPDSPVGISVTLQTGSQDCSDLPFGISVTLRLDPEGCSDFTPGDFCYAPTRRSGLYGHLIL
jgi:hypothetical protein